MLLERLEVFVDALKGAVFTTPFQSLNPDEALQHAYELLLQTKEQKGIVYLIGNGGSAGIASHIYADLLKNLHVRAMTLIDSNLLTAVGNDCGYREVFSLPLERLMRSEDLLIAISSSGQSPNILDAVAVAKKREGKVITLSGFKETNPLRQMGDLNFWIDHSEYGIVETGHFFLLHALIDCWLNGLFALRKSLVHV